MSKAQQEYLRHQWQQEMQFTTMPISFEAWLEQREKATDQRALTDFDYSWRNRDKP